MVSRLVTSRCIWRSVLLISVTACGATSPARVERAAELVLIGGDVHTMDPAHPHASAVAIREGIVEAVGSDADVRPWIGASTRVVMLDGATVTPGLVDAHCHLHGLGVDLDALDLRKTRSEQEVAELVRSRATDSPGTWVVGRGWDQNRWPSRAFPTQRSLETATRAPVLLTRIDGHAIWVNAAALAIAGITAQTADPPGGKIVRDVDGTPTGVLLDNAIELVEKHIPPATAAQTERRILAAVQVAIAAGITGVHEMGIDDATARAYRKLDDEGKLPLRVYAYHAGLAPGSPEPARGNFAMRGVKFFADGALGSRGARLYADYDDDPGNRGLWVTEPAQLAHEVEVAVAAGWQVAIHAIGDAGIGSVLDAYAAAAQRHPGDLRLRVEHLQVLAPADLPRLVHARAIASMQPAHATSDMPWAEARLGNQRILGAYAWRSMLEHHVPLAFGSDFPVEEVSPLLGIYAAVTRQDATGKPVGGWYAAQRMTLDEAIAAFTSGSAYAEFAESMRGTLAPGRTADLTVFDRPLAADRSLLETRVRMTIVGGQIVYASPEGRRR
jgi:predicted amidohydrolase YtcJ